jgi:Tol biopolymer transport system component
MNARHRRLGKRALLLLIFVLLNNAASATPFQLVSNFGNHPPAGGNGDSCLPVLSSDGQFVLFASTANNLLLSSNGLPIPSLVPAPFNVYLRDRSNQVTSLVSVNTNQTAGGNGNSIPAALSTNAQFVLFESSANNLVADDTNNATDIFLRDLTSGATSLVSVSTNGFAGNGASRSAVMTPDGRYVAFVSEAFNLVVGDANKIPDVFVRDMQTLTTTLISIGAVSTNPSPAVPFGGSESPEISADGRYVAFSSTATNLVPGVSTVGDIYVHDRVAGTNIWVSSGMRARLQTVTGKTNGVCYNLALSDDGKLVAYQASVSPLAAGANTGIILRYGLETGLTDLIHTNAPTSIPVPEETRTLDLTPDGSTIAFVANSNGVQATTTAVHIWNATSGLTTLASGNLSNSVTAGSLSARPVIDRNGRYVAFISTAPNLVTNLLSGLWHVYVRDLLTATTTLANAATNGTGSPVSPSAVVSLSDGGSVIAFEGGDGGLVSSDHNRALDIFVRDLNATTNELISAHHASLSSASAAGPSVLSAFAASADGRFVAFASEVDDPTMGDTNGYRDVFVRDLAYGTNRLMSVTPDGMTGNGSSSEPAISGDGRFVAFASAATNLASGDNNGLTDVFVRDLQTGIMTLASLDSTGGPANSNSFAPSLSSDGRWLLFRSQAKDLAAGSFSGVENLFCATWN